MAKMENEQFGMVPNKDVSRPGGFELDQKDHGTPPVYRGYGGDNGSHVSNYPTGNAFVAEEPEEGENKPDFAPEPRDSTGGMRMTNDLGSEASNPRVMPGMNGGGAQHMAFESLSTDGQGRGVESRDTKREMFSGNAGQGDMNPPMPKAMGGSALKGYS